MSNYTKITNFTAKDGLPSGDPNKVVSGQLFADEFDAIATAIASKAELGDIVQPDPLPVPRFEFYKSLGGITINFNNLGTPVQTNFVLSANDLVITNPYRLSFTFGSATSFITDPILSTVTRLNRSAEVFIRVTNTTLGTSFDTVPVIIGQAQEFQGSGSQFIQTKFRTPHHTEYFLDLSTLGLSNTPSDYTFTVFYTPTVNLTFGNASAQLTIDGSINLALEEIL